MTFIIDTYVHEKHTNKDKFSMVYFAIHFTIAYLDTADS